MADARSGNRVTKSPALSALVLIIGLLALAVLAVVAVAQGAVSAVIALPLLCAAGVAVVVAFLKRDRA